jgi:hypothetical protein
MHTLTAGEVFGSSRTAIFASNGDRWRRSRKAASHIFTKNMVSKVMPKVFAIQARMLLGLFERIAAPLDGATDGDGEAGSVIDIQRMFLNYTMDGFMR